MELPASKEASGRLNGKRVINGGTAEGFVGAWEKVPQKSRALVSSFERLGPSTSPLVQSVHGGGSTMVSLFLFEISVAHGGLAKRVILADMIQ